MSDREVLRWCIENYWTEPRKLDNGCWVAFPPGGVIETLVPCLLESAPENNLGKIEHLLYGLLAVIACTYSGGDSLWLCRHYFLQVSSKTRSLTNNSFELLCLQSNIIIESFASVPVNTS